MSTWKNFLLQDSASPLMEQLSYFHDHTLMILLIITILVGQLMISLFMNKFLHRFLLEGQMIEIIWTILPTITLIFIAIPSLRLIYILDELTNPLLTIKTIGHQWYWSYEYSDFKNIEFNSYMSSNNNLFNFRLLEVDNRIIIPFESKVRMLITATDVIHSWTIPALGMKIDATPGRLNQINFLLNQTGLFYGQCSEICGANHSFMPIVLESITTKFFSKWILKMTL
uniref:Cytochrome c oxidase subunit 2 n=1 Tax=Coleoptera sp. ACP-2013 TaxID=2485033 RepID=A0A3G3MEV9_9COLE|nr:cytochrome c oxidase subunit 2 [Coleoptera sp. ACP-2013]